MLAAALWPSIPTGKPENRVAGIIARGELRISTINSPMTFATMNNKAFGLDYELAKQFADYLGVTLKITVRQNISQLFDDLDDGQADMLAAGLVYNRERVKNYQAGPTYYSVSQQLVYRVGNTRPRTLAALTAEQLTIAPGHVAINDLQTLKAEKYPDLARRVDEKRGTTALMQAVIDGKLDYTIADSVAVSLFQRVHPELAVALDITDEQPVTGLVPGTTIIRCRRQCLISSITLMKTGRWRAGGEIPRPRQRFRLCRYPHLPARGGKYSSGGAAAV